MNPTSSLKSKLAIPLAIQPPPLAMYGEAVRLTIFPDYAHGPILWSSRVYSLPCSVVAASQGGGG
jgi:hypothetical protein